VKRWHYAAAIDARLDHHRAPAASRQFFSVACLEESAISGSHGNVRVTGEELRFEGGYRRKPALVRGIGAGPSGTYIFIRKAESK